MLCMLPNGTLLNLRPGGWSKDGVFIALMSDVHFLPVVG